MMHDEAVLCGTFSRDGEHLATGSTVSAFAALVLFVFSLLFFGKIGCD